MLDIGITAFITLALERPISLYLRRKRRSAIETLGANNDATLVLGRRFNNDHSDQERTVLANDVAIYADRAILFLGLSAMDPTAKGDMRADLMRRWYERNRETWWDRHRPRSDRSGWHADEWMIGLMNEANRILNLTDEQLRDSY